MMAFIIELKVIPSSSSHKWVLDKSGILKCYVKSRAQDGKANKELIANIARLAGVSPSMVDIVKGEAARNKVIKVSGPLTQEKFLELIGVGQQLSALVVG
jgi:uncharacterized protein